MLNEMGVLTVFVILDSLSKVHDDISLPVCIYTCPTSIYPMSRELCYSSQEVVTCVS